DARVVEQIRVMAGEDFCEYARAGGSSVTMQLGATTPAVLAKARADGIALPSLHSSLFAPDAKPAITTGIEAYAAAPRPAFSRWAGGARPAARRGLSLVFVPHLEIHELALTELPGAAAVLGRGMRDNPLHVRVFGEDPARREASLERFFLPVLRGMSKKG